MTDDPAQTLIQAVETADSAVNLLNAVRRLSEVRVEKAIPTLIAALGYNNPGVAVAAVEGLIQLGEPAVNALLEQLDDHNYGARSWAVRALAGIGDPRAIQTLLEAAQNDFAPSVRRAASKGLGALNWHQLPSAQISLAQSHVKDALIIVSQDPEWVVRYAAVVGLQELALAIVVSQTEWVFQILRHFDHRVDVEDSLSVIARICLAQQTIQQYAISILAKHAEDQLLHPIVELAGTPQSMDWLSTLDKIRIRKRLERPLPEGDPGRFREAAAAIGRAKT